jgi:glycosyltransferase involved in cell wall biosynthesis
VSTNISSIPEFIENGKHGILVEPDADALAQALAGMIADPAGRAKMAAAARQRLISDFGMDAGIAKLTARLHTALV